MRTVMTSLFLVFVLVFTITTDAETPLAMNYQKSVQDLQNAFKGETTASTKYASFADKAEKEGYDRIALLFRAASKAESIHAGNHKAVLEKMGADVPAVNPEFEVKSTKENLGDAISGESYEIATMYPDFIKDASAESASLAMISFNYAYQTEKKHKAMYEKALDALNAGSAGSLPDLYMVCTTCGNTYEGEAPARCGISMTPKERFVRIKL
ncbi:rubrerythrin family protein [Saccharicrinis sp. FJH54]|uniref:rubrerythrin family protein n=1 Tax=Saccharicrinis sp. FJH54 TaxID=3344665 RepID=UPI0035D4FF48